MAGILSPISQPPLKDLDYYARYQGNHCPRMKVSTGMLTLARHS